VLSCVQPVVRLYDIPNNTFESDESEEESSSEEEEDEEGEEDEDAAADARTDVVENGRCVIVAVGFTGMIGVKLHLRHKRMDRRWELNLVHFSLKM